MLTRLDLKRGYGKLVGAGSQFSTRKRRGRLSQFPPQVSPQVVHEASVSISHEGGVDNMLEDEKTLKKYFFDMTEMAKVLYEERNSRFQGESSKSSKGESSSRGKGGDDDKPSKGNGDKLPSSPSSSSPPSSPSSSSSSKTIATQTHPHTPRVHGKNPLLKLDIKFELPMYNGEVNAERLDDWVHQLQVY